MRLVVFFDLPVDTPAQRKDYRVFRKFLLKDGYLMLQESVYAKLVVNDGAAGSAVQRLRKHRPPSGLVQAFGLSRGLNRARKPQEYPAAQSLLASLQ